MKLELELFKHNTKADKSGPLEEFENINRLEREVGRYLVEAFGSLPDNELKCRWVVFTDHHNYYIQVEYQLNGNTRKLRMEFPFWTLNSRDDLLDKVVIALSEDLASSMVRDLMKQKHSSLDVTSARLKAAASK